MTSVMVVLLRTPRRKIGVLHLDRGPLQEPFTEDDLLLADALAAHVSAGIESAQLLRQQRELFRRTVSTLAEMVELRDKYTAVTRSASHVTLRCSPRRWNCPTSRSNGSVSARRCTTSARSASGTRSLQKPGRLTAAEFAEMQTHTTLGAEYLAGIPELHPIIPIVRNHHERWDGTGYPDRLAREEIPLLARIVSVADAFDAMTSHRPYHENKRGRTPAFAFAEVERQAGRQFDPACAAAFLEIQDQIVEVKRVVLPGTGSHVSIMGIPASADLPETQHGLAQPEELRQFDSEALTRSR